MNLPLNCTAEYFNEFLSLEEATTLYNALIDDYHLDKERLVVEAGGKLIETDSFKILFATERMISQNSHPEQIHGKSYVWSGAMAKLRSKVSLFLKKEFELAMCIYYPDGNYFAPYHSDQETSGHNTILPSLSLGEPRIFSFKNKRTQEIYELELANGSLLVMGDYCQSRYTHSLPRNLKYTRGRINITFRDPSFQ